MVAGLSGALSESHEVTVATPLYRGIREAFPDIEPIRESFAIPLGEGQSTGRWWQRKPSPNLTVLFLENEEFYNRQGIYVENGIGYDDNPARYIFFSKAVTRMADDFEALHLHDWQAGIIPMLLKEGAGEGVAKTIFTIHNLAYQGSCAGEQFELTNLGSELFHERGPEHFGGFNFMKAAIHYADAITTVSPQYANEILTGEFGEGLDGELLKRKGDLTGILNGVDYDEWRTRENPHLKAEYDSENLSGKAACKSDLLNHFNMPETGLPLFAVVSRLAEQKGIAQLVDTLSGLLPRKQFQFILLGSGDAEYEKHLNQLAMAHPDYVGLEIGYDQGLSHKIEAGADFFVMPSRFEPCGLNQLYSLRYGTIPIVHAVGGLKNSIIDVEHLNGNGISYESFTTQSLTHAIERGLELFADSQQMNLIRRRGMQADHSWPSSASQYAKIFQSLIN